MPVTSAWDVAGGSALPRLVAYARAVTGTLRPPTLLDHLVQEVKATLMPRDVRAISLDEQGHEESASGASEHPGLRAAVAEVIASGLTWEEPQNGGELLVLPLSGRRALLGVLAVECGRPLLLTERLLLEGLVAITTVALEGARLVAAAESSHRTWERATDAVDLALVVLDRAGRIERANRAFALLLDRHNTPMAGRPWAELLPSDWHQSVRESLAAETPTAVELSLGGRTLAVTTFRATAPEPERTVLVFEDQTDRRRLQERLVQSEKLSAIGQLIAGVAHDLNNPLTSVVGFADFLAETADVPSRLREPLRVIQQEAERASKIVKNLLSFARRQERRQLASLTPILEATIGLFRNQLSGERIALQLDLDPDLPDLDLSPNQVQQVFVNLIQNAAQAIISVHRPGTVRVRARRWMEGVAVDVSDDGPGMLSQVAERVFEPFFTTKDEGQGTGLGLSISQGIIKEHGGRITLATAPGAGATFTVEFPARVPGRIHPPAPVEPAAPRGLRVLVIDDEPHILHYLRATLEAWGHVVETALDGHTGLERALAGSFDLILSDLRMPRVGGREFYEQLMVRSPEAAARVAFSTGDTVRGDTMAFLEAQARPVLQKPFSLAELRNLLRDAAAP